MFMEGKPNKDNGFLTPKNRCNKICTHALLNLTHESGGFADRLCRLVIGSWGPVGCEVKFQHLTGVGV